MGSHALDRKRWHNALMESAEREGAKFGALTLPSFPSMEMQMNTVGASGKDAFADAIVFYEDCASRFSRSPCWERPRKRLLDFGCA